MSAPAPLPPLKIELPVDWQPRSYQTALFDEMVQTGVRPGKKRAILVWHRRGGKDLTCLQYTVQEAFRRPGLYWHVLPTYKQGRKIVWEGMTGDVRNPRKFLSYWPESTILRKRDDEMTLWLQGGSQWSVVGTEDVDRLVGSNPVGVVMSEFALQHVAVWHYLAPILVENGGWAIFPSTPRGYNHLWDLLRRAKEHPKIWFTQELTVDDTGAVPLELIEQERQMGMPEEIIQQEYYVSFAASLAGSFYSQQMQRMKTEGRLCNVPTMENLCVHTAWDLGMSDATAIWFFQRNRDELRFLDCYYASGQPLSHYARVLQEKREANNWVYGEHLLPHDAMVREYSTAKTRLQTLGDLGFRARAVPRMAFGDGIELVRAMLTRSLIDAEKCKTGIQALREYRKKETGLRDPDGNPVYADQPVHDWTSHLCDAIRSAACGLRGSSSFGAQKQRLYPEISMI